MYLTFHITNIPPLIFLHYFCFRSWLFSSLDVYRRSVGMCLMFASAHTPTSTDCTVKPTGTELVAVFYYCVNYECFCVFVHASLARVLVRADAQTRVPFVTVYNGWLLWFLGILFSIHLTSVCMRACVRACVSRCIYVVLLLVPLFRIRNFGIVLGAEWTPKCVSRWVSQWVIQRIVCFRHYNVLLLHKSLPTWINRIMSNMYKLNFTCMLFYGTFAVLYIYIYIYI